MSRTRRAWLLVGVVTAGILSTLGATAWACWRAANEVPDFILPPVRLPEPNAFDDFVAAGQLLDKTREDEPPGAPLPRLRSELRRNRKALARFRKALSRPYLAPPVTSLDIELPEVVLFRRFGRLLIRDARVALAEGRDHDAVRSTLDCLRLGVVIPRGGELIFASMGKTLQEMALDGLQGQAGRMDDGEAGETLEEMRRLQAVQVPLRETMVLERDFGTLGLTRQLKRPDGLRRLVVCYSGPVTASAPVAISWDSLAGLGESLLALPSELEYSYTSRRQLIATYRASWDHAIAWCEKPIWVPMPSLPRPRRSWEAAMQAAWDCRLPYAQRDAHWRITETLLACRAYQVRRGTLPPSLQALVPEYLPAVPRDPFADAPLVYRKREKQPLVYSRGPDGEDDGGKVVKRSDLEQDGDIVTVAGTRGRAAGQY